MLRYLSRMWLNGIRNQTEAFAMVLLMELSISKLTTTRKTAFRQGV